MVQLLDPVWLTQYVHVLFHCFLPAGFSYVPLDNVLVNMASRHLLGQALIDDSLATHLNLSSDASSASIDDCHHRYLC
ncbi:hypothetical protein WL26_24045 [Burkholderia cepacia]|nr:hypothetical protein WL26_24045 [Burkholderia cepacia]